jgi:hypothetical protein
MTPECSTADSVMEGLKKQAPRRRMPGRRSVALLVLGSLALWWNWPRGDTRFVGTWRLYRQNRSQPSFVLTMHCNGGGWTTHLLNGRYTRLKWSVKGQVLTMGYGEPGRAPALMFRIQGWLQRNLGWHPWIVWAEQWQVVAVTPGEIRIRPLSGPNELMTLRRIE